MQPKVSGHKTGHIGHSSDPEKERSSQNWESPESQNVPKVVPSSTFFVSLKLEKNKEKLLPPFFNWTPSRNPGYSKETLLLPASSEVLRLQYLEQAESPNIPPSWPNCQGGKTHFPPQSLGACKSNWQKTDLAREKTGLYPSKSNAHGSSHTHTHTNVTQGDG